MQVFLLRLQDVSLARSHHWHRLYHCGPASGNSGQRTEPYVCSFLDHPFNRSLPGVLSYPCLSPSLTFPSQIGWRPNLLPSSYDKIYSFPPNPLLPMPFSLLRAIVLYMYHLNASFISPTTPFHPLPAHPARFYPLLLLPLRLSSLFLLPSSPTQPPFLHPNPPSLTILISPDSHDDHENPPFPTTNTFPLQILPQTQPASPPIQLLLNQNLHAVGNPGEA